MCGICGIAGFEGMAPDERASALVRMNAGMRHRGPDDSGCWVNGVMGLGNVRLSIVDLAHGHQPMIEEASGLVVVFNGEIFNHPELRRELEERGHRFCTTSDTEVLLHLYREYGDGFVNRLIGQFAFAIWDPDHRRLFGARDRLGVRPFFYHLRGGDMVFASTIRSLVASGLVPRALDPARVRDVFTFWVPMPGETVFQGVREIPAGHCFDWEPGREPRLHRYWDLEFASGRGELLRIEERAEELLALLEDAVRIRLRADVPVGAYLSGGLDSSLVAALVRRIHPRPLCTFSLGFAEPELDERPWQRLMVDSLGTEHKETVTCEEEVAQAFPAAVLHSEVPLLRTGPVPMMALARLVRASGFKVVLTGEGADEFCAGYNIFKEALVRRFWARFPSSSVRPRLFDRIYPYMSASRQRTGEFWSAFFSHGLNETTDPFYSHRIRWKEGSQLGRFLLSGNGAEVEQEERLRAMLPERFFAWHPLEQAQFLEASLFLPGYLLSSQGDRMMLAHSVEGRFPFLDHRVVEFCNRLPPSVKLLGLEEKKILKRAAAGLVPAPILTRPKQPYRGPAIVKAMLTHGAAGEGGPLSPAAVADAGLFEPRAIEGLVAKCRTRDSQSLGNRDVMAFLAILSTQILHNPASAMAMAR